MSTPGRALLTFLDNGLTVLGPTTTTAGAESRPGHAPHKGDVPASVCVRMPS